MSEGRGVETIRVRTHMEHEVPVIIANKLCDDFIEWLGSEGLLLGDAATEWKGRDYADVVAQFIEEYA